RKMKIPIATQMNRRGRALTMRSGLGRRRCSGAGATVIPTFSRSSARHKSLAKQPRPFFTLIEKFRDVDEDEPIRRGLHARIRRNGFAARKNCLTVGQQEILEQQRRVWMGCSTEHADAGR